MRTIASTCFALALAALTPLNAWAQNVPFTAAQARAIDEIGRSEIRAHSTPGLAIGIVQDGLLVYAQGFGYASLQRRRAVSAGTQFYVGGIDEQFTAACILLLAQQKKIALTDRVTKYIPELTAAGDATIEELLLQTAGLPAGPNIEAVKGAEPAAAAGTVFADNPLNYYVAGKIVERVSGLPLSVAKSTMIFQPLIMTSTFLNGDQGISPTHAVGYARQDGRFVPARAPGASWGFGSSALVTTVQDLAKWDIGLPLLLNVDSVREMWTPAQLPNDSYGMGWVIDSRGGQRYLWQNGEIAGYRAMNALLPDRHIAVIVLANAGMSAENESTVEPERVANRILDAIAPLPQAHVANDVVARATEWIGRLQGNRIDRTQLTADFSQYLSDAVVERANLKGYGPLISLTPIESDQRSNDVVYVFDAKFRSGSARFLFGLTPDGKIDELFLEP
jgi:D-alanyl-D-alanine carboxypeptidase